MIAEKFNSKCSDFMDKHPKATKLLISGAVASSMFMPVVASAEGEVGSGTGTVSSVDIGTVIDSLVSSAQTAYCTGINRVTPVLITVIGFNVAVKLVRRFVKG